MRIAITGSSGLLGSAIVRRLERDGHAITRVVRSREAAAAPDAVYWSPAAGEIDAAALADHDAVINLAGENIAGIWTEAKKRRIHDSRVDGTRLLATTLAALRDPAPGDFGPRTLINASAVGYYGDRPDDQPLDETAPPGTGFSARMVADWEAATGPARDAGIRVVMTRFGIVLDPASTLVRLSGLATRLGLGAALGRGDQVLPWVTRRDVAGVMAFLLAEPGSRPEPKPRERPDPRGEPGSGPGRGLDGVVNVVAPQRVTNEEYADALASALDRPRFLRIPAFAVRLAGELGDEVLGGAWVVPRKLQDAGYAWRDPELEPALREMLDR